MRECEKNNFWVEIENNLINFYIQDEKMYLRKYTNNIFVEERSIIDKCKELKSVFLSKGQAISIIYVSLSGELILSNFSNDNIENNIVLMRSSLNGNDIQITSVNNSLNIFYTIETEKEKSIYFRILTNKLTLTPSVKIDNIETSCSTPFVVSASDDGLAICYIKKGYPYSIGYRIYDLKTNTWLKFNELDISNFRISNFDFSRVGDIIGYSYICSYNERTNIICWIGNGKIKNKLIQELAPNIDLMDMYIADNNKLYLIYLIKNLLKIKELDIDGSGKSIEDINFSNLAYAKKYNYTSDKNIAKNNILVINSNDIDIFTDSQFIKKRIIKSFEYSVNSSDNIMNDSVIAIKAEDLINNSSMVNNSIDIEYIKLFIVKIKEYERAFNELSEKLEGFDDKNKGLIKDIDDLNNQLNMKNYEINELQDKLIENKIVIKEYEDKFNKLEKESESISKDNNLKVLELNEEIVRLQEKIDIFKVEKKENLEEIENLKIKINYLRSMNEEDKNKYNEDISNKENIIKEINEKLSIKNESIKQLLDEIKKIDSDSKKEILELNDELLKLRREGAKYTEEINRIIEDRNSYINEVEVLKRNVDKLNETIKNNKNKINDLKSTIEILEQKNSTDSFIKKLFRGTE